MQPLHRPAVSCRFIIPRFRVAVEKKMYGVPVSQGHGPWTTWTRELLVVAGNVFRKFYALGCLAPPVGTFSFIRRAAAPPCLLLAEREIRRKRIREMTIKTGFNLRPRAVLAAHPGIEPGPFASEAAVLETACATVHQWAIQPALILNHPRINLPEPTGNQMRFYAAASRISATSEIRWSGRRDSHPHGQPRPGRSHDYSLIAVCI